MKLRNKAFTCFVTMVLALVMMTGTVFASTNKLPFKYGKEADVKTNNDVWVKLIGGKDASGAPVSTEKVAHQCKTVDVYFSGKATSDIEIIFNSDFGWKPLQFKKTKVNGTKVISRDMDGTNTTYCECVVNCIGKTKGDLNVDAMVFKNAKGKAIFTWGKLPKKAKK